MILLSWRPKNWKIKKRRCLHGRSEREKEKGAPLACLLTDTRAWHSVCSRLLICSNCDISELAILSCLNKFFCFFLNSFCSINVVSPLPCHYICSDSALVASSGNMHSQSRLYTPFCYEAVWAVQVCRRSIYYLAGFMTKTQDGNRIIA